MRYLYGRLLGELVVLGFRMRNWLHSDESASAAEKVCMHASPKRKVLFWGRLTDISALLQHAGEKMRRNLQCPCLEYSISQKRPRQSATLPAGQDIPLSIYIDISEHRGVTRSKLSGVIGSAASVQSRQTLIL